MDAPLVWLRPPLLIFELHQRVLQILQISESDLNIPKCKYDPLLSRLLNQVCLVLRVLLSRYELEEFGFDAGLRRVLRCLALRDNTARVQLLDLDVHNVPVVFVEAVLLAVFLGQYL